MMENRAPAQDLASTDEPDIAPQLTLRNHPPKLTDVAPNPGAEPLSMVTKVRPQRAVPLQGLFDASADTNPPQPPPKGAQSIHRAIDVFVVVGEHDADGVRLTDVAQLTGLHVATAHRLLNALVWDRMVTYDSYTKRYSLGVRFHSMTDSARFGKARQQFADAMTRIAGSTGDVVYLYLPLGAEIICAERIEGSYPIKALIREKGARLPMGAGAGGIAMLAAQSERKARQIIEFNAGRYPQYGLTAEEVSLSVTRARIAGYGLNRDQVMKGVTGIGVALLDPTGKPQAAITVVGVSQRFDNARIESVAATIRAEASNSTTTD